MAMGVMETVTWEQCRAATEELMDRLTALDDDFIAGLDKGSGMYVVAYAGTELGGSLWGADKPKIVYIGKNDQDSSRHFTSGNTGNSTLRRSLAALLATKLNLRPIPRSADESDNDRYDNYMLDVQSEDKLTEWMRGNFTVAFLDVADDKAEAMLKAMIQYSVPMFNFQNNPENKYGAEIKVYRKRLAEEARQKDKQAKIS